MRTTAKLFLLVGSAVAAVVPALPAHAAVTTDAAISNFSFSPDPLTIDAGDTVRWTNKDATSHTVTADDGSFTSQSLGSQAPFTHTFSQPGVTVTYHCAIHPGMTGSVVVRAVPTTAAPATTTTAAPTTTTTAAPTTTSAPTSTTTIAGGSAAPTTAGNGAPRATSPKPAVSPTTRATVATTTTAAPAAPVPAAPAVDGAAAPAPRPAASSPPSTDPVLDTASSDYGSGGGSAGIGPAVAAVAIVGGGAAAGWWFIRRRRSAA
jgi:plastocyanin